MRVSQARPGLHPLQLLAASVSMAVSISALLVKLRCLLTCTPRHRLERKLPQTKMRVLTGFCLYYRSINRRPLFFPISVTCVLSPCFFFHSLQPHRNTVQAAGSRGAGGHELAFLGPLLLPCAVCFPCIISYLAKWELRQDCFGSWGCKQKNYCL